ncbi:hypothetical protein GF345_04075 [Candidatus Woesearchaeota archaeon]|nr:hypothetical protein [Candidatus Woesearchaeota archaeon]
MNIRCLRCKGRHHCGRSFCPIQAKIAAQKKVNTEAKQDYFGESPNVFVGHYGYPDLNVGFLNVEQYNQHDNPLLWSREDYDINRIIGLRSELVNSGFKARVTDARGSDKLLEMGKEIAMSVRPVDMEISLDKKPQFSLNFGQETAPYGPRVGLKRAEITENPHIPSRVEKVVDDDVKATHGLNMLYSKGYDEHYLTKLLSVGTLGMRKSKKIVPTRWSITAVDDNVCKNLLKGIKEKQYPDTGYLAYFGSHLGNYYLVLFFPDVWSYELFETYVGGADYEWPFATDHEGYNGRKEYAHATAGGYYAARLAVAEKLSEIKRQGSCLCLRFITNEYWAPLGVWVVREATRNAMASKPIEFGSKELMLEYARHLVKKKFGYNLDNILGKSILLRNLNSQMKLNKYLHH